MVTVADQESIFQTKQSYHGDLRKIDNLQSELTEAREKKTSMLSIPQHRARLSQRVRWFTRMVEKADAASDQIDMNCPTFLPGRVYGRSR
eukprot:3346268-Pyramimonas_sp.AAC.1